MSIVPETLGQYIGLKDVNGKKLFEVDIVVLMKSVAHSYNKGTKFIICYSDNELCYVARYIYGNEKSRLLRVTKNKKFKVIGNIYDNSDLLKN